MTFNYSVFNLSLIYFYFIINIIFVVIPIEYKIIKDTKKDFISKYYIFKKFNISDEK